MKKIYVDGRVTPNKGTNTVNLSNQVDLKKHTEQVITQYNIDNPEWTETTITISPTQTTYSDGRTTVASGILALGTSPIELLPAPGAGKYHDFDRITIQVIQNTTGYTIGGAETRLNFYDSKGYESYRINKSVLTDTSEGNTVASFQPINAIQLRMGFGDAIEHSYKPTNSSYSLRCYNFDLEGGPINPSGGDSTMKVIIRYKIVTFG